MTAHCVLYWFRIRWSYCSSVCWRYLRECTLMLLCTASLIPVPFAIIRWSVGYDVLSVSVSIYIDSLSFSLCTDVVILNREWITEVSWDSVTPPTDTNQSRRASTWALHLCPSNCHAAINIVVPCPRQTLWNVGYVDVIWFCALSLSLTPCCHREQGANYDGQLVCVLSASLCYRTDSASPLFVCDIIVLMRLLWAKGYGDTSDRGDAPNEMGDNLPEVCFHRRSESKRICVCYHGVHSFSGYFAVGLPAQTGFGVGDLNVCGFIRKLDGVLGI